MLPSHSWTCSLLTPRPAVPSHPWACSLLTPGPALPSHPWTCSPLQLGPPPREDVVWSGPWSPGFGAHPGGPPGPPCTSLPGSIQPSCIPISSPPKALPWPQQVSALLGEGLSAVMATATWLHSPGQSPYCHPSGLFLIQCLII